jgi:hypothetical protein
VLQKQLVFLAFKFEQCYHMGNFHKKVSEAKKDIWDGLAEKKIKQST